MHKFRSTIGKSKQIHAGDHVLVATSGGVSSAALLHLLHEGLNENSHKRLRFEPAFLYVDGMFVYKSSDVYCEICTHMRKGVAKRPLYVITLWNIVISVLVERNIMARVPSMHHP